MNLTAAIAPPFPDRAPRDGRWMWLLAMALPCSLPLALATPTSADAGHPHEATIAAFVDPLYRRDLEPMAAVSCAASSCHGGSRPGTAQPSAAGDSAYPLWLERDPHARSWQTLCSSESVSMMARLGIFQDGRITDQAGFDNCLSCHNTGRSEPAARVLTHASRPRTAAAPETFSPRHSEGVGCAACHGPAEHWISQHYLAGWQPEQAIAQGFVANDDLLTRARLCASCHVGDHDRDMNHDIIAAGHPALRFEMASHHDRLPKHWRDSDAADRPRFEARLWTAGAVASADAWLALQQGRAQRLTAVSTWPELAAHDCSSCHQALRLDSDRDPLSDPGGRGTAKMARWDLAPLMLWAHAGLASPDRRNATAAADLLDRLDDFRRTLEVMPSAATEEVAVAAAGVRQQLAAWAGSQPRQTSRTAQSRSIAPPDPSMRLVDLIVRSSARAEPTQTWEAAAQFYLLLAASQFEWPRDIRPELQAHAQQMRLGLALPAGFDSPRYSLTVPLGPQLTRTQTERLTQRILATLERATDSLPQPIHLRHTPLNASSSTGPSIDTQDAPHASVR